MTMSLQSASNSVFDTPQSQIKILTNPKLINLALTLQNIFFIIMTYAK
jgi:hypothetical protein